jgi:DNA invertase Pin-like site-specific DNA recombinase
VSTVEQNLDMQVRALEAAGVRVGDIHVEKVSATSKLRPKLEWAMANLRPGDTLIVWKLDRFARSMQDLLKGLQILQQSGAGFRSLTEHIDTTTPAGMLMVHVLGALAQFERDLVVQRTRHGVAAAKARGVKFGQPKKLNAKQEAQCKRWKKEGRSVREIVDLVAEQYEITVSQQTVWKTTRDVKRK